ncbi:PREDICTED: glycine-rich protein 5-like [Nelumbo nucifera]|uniref:Glycine-rich protein 5-like n=2 Tax=Nelumbo nucifera TaxID=4432 RepID=A0A822YS09_NELNU|nr:PREDICTED: glycine-rich protein 5-like [Nelumbo nucifera]DAD36954.1 TPA_asm: hypothetical protein HUJ06_007595 [Nelumbo nucifera]
MARWGVMLVLVLTVVNTTARNLPNKDAGLNDQKNFISFGGVGGYAGLGGGLPSLGGGIGGVAGVMPIGGGFGGTTPLGGFGGGSGGGAGGGGGLPLP